MKPKCFAGSWTIQTPSKSPNCSLISESLINLTFIITEIAILPRSWDQIDEMIKAGELTDSVTIASLYLARRVLDD